MKMDTGITFPSIKHAARFIEGYPYKIRKAIKLNRRYKGTYWRFYLGSSVVKFKRDHDLQLKESRRNRCPCGNIGKEEDNASWVCEKCLKRELRFKL